MGKVTCNITVSVDGFVAGPNQSPEQPLGDGGESLHRWMFEQPGANAPALAEMASAGAYIMGRNMYAPGRGPWDRSWQGWWGDEPPFHAPVFVLTHHPRDPLVLKGGTSFTFVSDGIGSALEQAKKAAGAGTVAISGGAATVNQFLVAGLIDELFLHVAPLTLGAGKRLFTGVGRIGLDLLSSSSSELVVHLKYRILS